MLMTEPVSHDSEPMQCIFSALPLCSRSSAIRCFSPLLPPSPFITRPFLFEASHVPTRSAGQNPEAAMTCHHLRTPASNQTTRAHSPLLLLLLPFLLLFLLLLLTTICPPSPPLPFHMPAPLGAATSAGKSQRDAITVSLAPRDSLPPPDLFFQHASLIHALTMFCPPPSPPPPLLPSPRLLLLSRSFLRSTARRTGAMALPTRLVQRGSWTCAATWVWSRRMSSSSSSPGASRWGEKPQNP